MRICERHEQQLREQIRDRGMNHLVHHDHDEIDELADTLCGRWNRQPSFDPLRSAADLADSIVANYSSRELQIDGACPICELIEHGPGERIDPDRHWVDVLMNHVEVWARAHGLMPRAA